MKNSYSSFIVVGYTRLSAIMSTDVLKVLVAQTGIYEFKIGMEIEVDYVNPTDGWVSIWLEDVIGNVVLNFSCRITEKVLVLNTLQGGKCMGT